MRLNDKVTRLKSLARNGKLYNESAEDSMRDIAVYAVIALVLWEEDMRANEDGPCEACSRRPSTTLCPKHREPVERA